MIIRISDQPTLWDSLLTVPIHAPIVPDLYLWTWLMIGTVAVMLAGLWITRDWEHMA